MNVLNFYTDYDLWKIEFSKMQVFAIRMIRYIIVEYNIAYSA